MNQFRQFLKDEWPFPHLVILIFVVSIGLTVANALIVDEKAECKPVPQLSEILK